MKYPHFLLFLTFFCSLKCHAFGPKYECVNGLTIYHEMQNGEVYAVAIKDKKKTLLNLQCDLTSGYMDCYRGKDYEIYVRDQPVNSLKNVHGNIVPNLVEIEVNDETILCRRFSIPID